MFLQPSASFLTLILSCTLVLLRIFNAIKGVHDVQLYFLDNFQCIKAIIYEDLINDKEKSGFIMYHLLATNRYAK